MPEDVLQAVFMPANPMLIFFSSDLDLKKIVECIFYLSLGLNVFRSMSSPKYIH